MGDFKAFSEPGLYLDGHTPCYFLKKTEYKRLFNLVLAKPSWCRHYGHDFWSWDIYETPYQNHQRYFTYVRPLTDEERIHFSEMYILYGDEYGWSENLSLDRMPSFVKQMLELDRC